MKKTIRFQQRKQKKKRMRIIVLTLCFVFAVLVFVFLKTFELNTIVIEGNTRYTEQEIKDLLLTKATDHVSLFFTCGCGGREQVQFHLSRRWKWNLQDGMRQ